MFCPDCQLVQPDVVIDNAAGDVICANCGLVLEDRTIDENSEWRTFGSGGDKSAGADPNRVGSPTNPHLGGAGLSTVIGKGSGDRLLNRASGRAGAGATAEYGLLRGFTEIARVADRINLNHSTKETSQELFKIVFEDGKAIRSRGFDESVAACVYMACRKEGFPRTLKEVCAVSSAEKNNIARAYKIARKVLQEELSLNMGVVSASDYLPRFCSALGLPHQLKNAARSVQDAAHEIGVASSRQPTSRAAASIFIVLMMLPPGERPIVETTGRVVGKGDVAEIAGITESTIDTVYRYFFPHIRGPFCDCNGTDAPTCKFGQCSCGEMERRKSAKGLDADEQAGAPHWIDGGRGGLVFCRMHCFCSREHPSIIPDWFLRDDPERIQRLPRPEW